uniref:C-type lectin domain-containing protein n=1 Tax=Pelusios castaneus TaxID=367368 RepID=A0A8C8VL90_9SAUR
MAGLDTEGNATISQRAKETGPIAGPTALLSTPPWLGSTPGRTCWDSLPRPGDQWDLDSDRPPLPCCLLDFMVRHNGKSDHWIGLQRDLGQSWKWANGTEFNNLFLIGGGGGDCAYLNSQGGVSSLQCASERHWICSKPDVFTKGKEVAVDEGS